jgi:hypothetical protein
MASIDPDQPAGPGQDVTREMVLALAFGQELTRVTRRLDEADKRVAGFEAQVEELAGLLICNANDIKALVSRADKQAKGAPPRSWLLAQDVGQAVVDLEDLTVWLGRVYLRYPGRSCRRVGRGTRVWWRSCGGCARPTERPTPRPPTRWPRRAIGTTGPDRVSSLAWRSSPRTATCPATSTAGTASKTHPSSRSRAKPSGWPPTGSKVAHPCRHLTSSTRPDSLTSASAAPAQTSRHRQHRSHAKGARSTGC